MINSIGILESILQEVKGLNDRISRIEEKTTTPLPSRIPLGDFCKVHAITRPTVYAWEDRGLIRTELIGGRRYVISDSIRVNGKYQRQDNESINVNIR